MRNDLLLDRLIDTPLLAERDKALVVAGLVARRGGVEVNVSASAEAHATPKAGPLQQRRLARRGAGFLFDAETGIAVVEVVGSLVHRSGYVGAQSGIMGYDSISTAFAEAMAEPTVRGVIIDVHSYGGEVAGCFQLADRIFAARGQKPIIAISDEAAYSAAYAIAAAADEVWLASSLAGVGSIGAVVVHLSYAGALEKDGIKATVITSGKLKAAGNPYEDLPDEIRDRLQAEISMVGDQFVDRIARWRGMSKKAVKATEAATFRGDEAVRLRLADGIADPGEVFHALADQVGSRRLTTVK